MCTRSIKMMQIYRAKVCKRAADTGDKQGCQGNELSGSRKRNSQPGKPLRAKPATFFLIWLDASASTSVSASASTSKSSSQSWKISSGSRDKLTLCKFRSCFIACPDLLSTRATRRAKRSTVQAGESEKAKIHQAK